jgi:RNA polymerase primary sigma factor
LTNKLLCGIIAAFSEGGVVDITNTSNLAADRALAYEAIERQPETEEIAASNEQEAEAKQPGNIGDHVAMYLSQIGSIPIMPQVEANRCIEKVQKGNAAAEQLETLRVIAEESGNAVDPEIKKDLMKAIEAGRRAKDKVVEGNLRLVVSIAKKYINSADSMVFMDLIQEGNIGLMRSIDSFDISRNVKFSTYATFWIRQNITRALATTDPAIRKPIYVAEGRRSVNNAKEQMQQKGLPCDDPLEIAKYMEGDAWDSLSKREQQKKLRIIQHSLQYRKPDSLDAPVNSDAASDSNTPLSEFIPSHNEWDNPEISTSGKALWETMDKILHDMPARDACVLRLRFGLEDGCAYTLKEIGDEMDLTRERVRQVTDKTLDKLRNGKAGKMLQDFLE